MAAFDIESDGKLPTEAHIITADLIICGVGVEEVRKSWVVKPDRTIPDEAAKIHGYSTERAEAEGTERRATIAQIQYEVIAALKTHPLVIFNAPYDLTLLDRECDRLGLPRHPHKAWRPVIDPLVIDKHCHERRPGSRKLGDMYAHYYPGRTLKDAHTSSADALGAARIAYKLGDRYPKVAAMSLEELHDAQVGWKAEQSKSLEEHFARKDAMEKAEVLSKVGVWTPRRVAGEWPVLPVGAVSS
jgi:DNA polymerase-3 subunit epsilon